MLLIAPLMELKCASFNPFLGTTALLIAPLMELKWVFIPDFSHILFTFNRTAYGIEMENPLAIIITTAGLLIAPLMELKYDWICVTDSDVLLLIAPLMELK